MQQNTFRTPQVILILSMLSAGLYSNQTKADTPLGWINSQNSSAYTTSAQHLELSLSTLRVNDNIDFLNIRDDLLAGNRRLEGDSGDLKGHRFEAYYGVTDWLSVFYRNHKRELTVDLGEVSSVNVLDISPAIETDTNEYGLKWTFYQADILNSQARPTAASLQLSWFNNDSDSFDVVTDSITLDSININFADPRTFFVGGLEDEGWDAKLIYSTQLINNSVGSFWVGYRDTDSQSITDSNIDSEIVAQFFKQEFQLAESYWMWGASIDFQINPRMPISIAYEYFRTNNSTFIRNPLESPAALPGFLTANPSLENQNHTLKAQLGYWITPELNINITGNLYSNQFLGVIPHYNNPLSGSFADNPYGYIGIGAGYQFSFQN